MIDDEKTILKDYLFWIATLDTVDVKDQPLIPIQQVPYVDDLKAFEKYHYKRVSYTISQRGQLTKLKENQVK